jgi:beta-hydroxylase
MGVFLGMMMILLFTAASLYYAYKLRGKVRWESFSEYLRKGWPIFTPLNSLLYLFSQKRALHPICNLNEYPELKVIEDNWEIIRAEAKNLLDNKYFEKTTAEGSAASYDIGFRTFFKYGWSKFYLTWYGNEIKSANELCPQTVALLAKVPSVNGAMFSYLPAGSQLTRHLDPLACSLRYHLGLVTPNSDHCFINVDNETHSWRDGKGLLFDETYLHFVKNNTDQGRLILMCDVDRPMNFLGAFINFCYKGLARLTTVPNLEGDKQGLANRIFATLSPLLAKSKQLKTTNRPLYLLVKYSVNTCLLLVVLGVLFLFLKGLSSITSV